MILSMQRITLAALSLAALGIFAWPFFGLNIEPNLASWLGFGAVAILLLASLGVLDGDLIGPKQIAMLAILAALGSGIRVATGGTGGFELVFITVILGGRAFGPRFGFLLGASTIAVSSLFFGGFGPWTGYQMFATAWVGAGAGLLFGKQRRFENLLLAGYGVVASYIFGLLLNLWFWPVATVSSSLAYDPDGMLFENITSFLSFSLLTSTLSWDTVRAISVGALLILFARPALRALRRAKF